MKFLIKVLTISGRLDHGWTYSAHPIGAAAGLANLNLIESENMLANVKSTGSYFQTKLRDAFTDHPMVGEVRGDGMLAAIEFVADKDSKTFFDPSLKIGAKMAGAALEHGVIARTMPHGDIMGFAPPLCISEAEVDEIITVVGKALDQVHSAL